MYHCVDTGAVWQTSVHHRCRFVDPPPNLANDLVDDPLQMGRIDEPGFRLAQPSVTLNPYRMWPVDHHLCHFRVGEERVDGAITEDVVCDLLQQRQPVGTRQRDRLFLVERPLQHFHHTELQLRIRHLLVVQGLAEAFYDLVMQLSPQLLTVELALGVYGGFAIDLRRGFDAVCETHVDPLPWSPNQTTFAAPPLRRSRASTRSRRPAWRRRAGPWQHVNAGIARPPAPLR